MTKKTLPLFALIILAAGSLSYKLGSAPVALAKPRTDTQEIAEQAASPTLPTAPATWTAHWPVSNPISQDPSVTRAAGGAGVKHVATCISVHFINSSGTLVSFPVELRDGPSGTGTTLAEWQIGSTATNGPGAQIELCDLNIVGSANTPMTLEVNPGNWGAKGTASVNLVGYDAQ